MIREKWGVRYSKCMIIGLSSSNLCCLIRIRASGGLCGREAGVDFPHLALDLTHVGGRFGSESQVFPRGSQVGW